METLTRLQHDATREAARIEEHVLLEGPHSRRRELGLVLRAVRDFIAGFRALHFAGPVSRSSARPAIRSRTPTTPWPVTWALPSSVSDSP